MWFFLSGVQYFMIPIRTDVLAVREGVFDGGMSFKENMNVDARLSISCWVEWSIG